jgi:hypothetical protein
LQPYLGGKVPGLLSMLSGGVVIREYLVHWVIKRYHGTIPWQRKRQKIKHKKDCVSFYSWQWRFHVRYLVHLWRKRWVAMGGKC